MTFLQALIVLLVVLSLVYAAIYAGWLPRPHRSPSRAGTFASTGGNEPWVGTFSGGSERSLTLAWGEGTYLSTSMAISRNERVNAAGLDVRIRANMVVDDSSVRWEREGLGQIRVEGSRLLGVRVRRDLADMLLGQAQIVLVSWRAGSTSDDTSNNTSDDTRNNTSDGAHNDTSDGAHNGETDDDKGDLYVTAFLPRSRTDSAALVSAVQRLMKMDGTS
jgi:hypothetical protein